MNLNFIEHIGNECPVYSGSYVVYRTTSKLKPLSHIHVPMMASELSWGDTTKISGVVRPMYMGRIKDYVVVERPDLPLYNVNRKRIRKAVA